MTANLQASAARWDDIQVFLAVHRAGTLALAASRLGLDTSTVSRRLAALERDLGVALFERTRSGLLPARAADRVLAAAEAMEAAHALLSREATEVETTAEGVVRISTAPGFASVFIAPGLVRLRKRHPRLTVELDASALPRDLTRREADVAVRSVRSQGADLVTTRLVSARWVACASSKLVARHGPVAAWDDVPWITWDRDLASFPPSRWVATHVPASSIALRTSDFISQLVAAAAGLGALLAPLPYLARNNLVELPFASALAATAEGWPTDDLWLVGHRTLRDLPRVAAVWTFLAEELRDAGKASMGEPAPVGASKR